MSGGSGPEDKPLTPPWQIQAQFNYYAGVVLLYVCCIAGIIIAEPGWPYILGGYGLWGLDFAVKKFFGEPTEGDTDGYKWGD